MKGWFAAAVCGVLLLACSPGTTSGDAPTSRLTPSRAPRSQPATKPGPPQASDPAARRVLQLRCFGRRPTIVGSPSNDRLRGTRRPDVIVSLGGNDVVSGLTRRDTVCTGSGHDRVDERDDRDFPYFAAFRIDLGEGDDVSHVSGHGFDDTRGTIIAGAGNDTILLSKHRDAFVDLGSGDDLIRTAPRRVSVTATWLDMCVSFRSATGPVHVNLARGRATGQGRDRLVNIRCVVGSRFNDVLIGSDRNDGIDAGGGLNLVRAGAGNDDVTGGARADEVHLGPGADSGSGESGWDRLYGGPGPDEIMGGPDGDYLDGGAGDDYLYSGGGCFNSWESSPGAMNEMMYGSAPNEVFGRAGNDFLSGERGNDRLDGGSGFDGGTGGYHDGRIDWTTSFERSDECNSPPDGSPLLR
jgi:Ca2+-binding RTX toxin-like protein